MDAQFRSRCPIASSLDLLGDRWTLVVIRTLMAGALSYSDLLAAPEKIATNVLADRLGRLEASGLVSSSARRGVGKVRKTYRLTPAGADLLPVLQALSAWGEVHIPGRWRTPDWFKAARAEDFLRAGDDRSQSEYPH
ncbi:MAG TPA: helix-turn-helix domain-containing protein [Phenylobacterium sp.]|jgi:DNA-binding HxlR family transcriptional regulator|uniref:winged helix-turn-helix transcriptional regulator n=1 Tax=Phenylobacterium sp. TaxID=1871053 RepID=UPI002CF441A8|nr:helix-turn-helix domain-containing protein [Phenylobacterium sp.]HXA40005.1 helix-turn-helix domain-containing protein [Phenylobacterium sp.]